MDDYGKCSVCDKQFEYGETATRVTPITFGQSQGYATEWAGLTFTLCKECIGPLNLKKKREKPKK